MRTLKITLVIIFCLAPLSPLISTRVAAVAATITKSGSPAVNTDGTAGDTAKEKRKPRPPVDPRLARPGSAAPGEIRESIPPRPLSVSRMSTL